MVTYVGRSYFARGGDAQLQRRFAQLAKMQSLAAREGLVEPGSFGVPEGMKSAFFGLVDVISRPNYAMAGGFETLIRKGQPGEWVPERMFRELFSGIAGLEGDKEAFGEVLEQAGVGEGGRLSDLIGENGVTRRWDPTLRGTVGLALDIFADPLTYISAPAKNAAVVLGRGGEVRYLTKAGMRQVGERYSARIAAARKSLNLADDVGEDVVLKRLSDVEEFQREFGDLAKAMSAGDRMSALQAQSVIRRQIGKDLLEETAGQSTDLFLQKGLRFRVPGVVDVPVLVDQAFQRATASVGRLIRSGMDRTSIGRWLVKEGTDAMEHLSLIFTRHPLFAHRHKAYIAMEEERWAMHNGAEHLARLEAKDILAGVPLKVRENEEFITAMARYVENPGLDEARTAFLKISENLGVENPIAMLERFQNRMITVAGSEFKVELLNEELVKEMTGRYFPRDLSKVERAKTSRVMGGSDRLSINLGQYAEPRHLKSFDEYVSIMREKGLGDQINWNLNEIIANRLKAHYQSMIDLHFVEEVNRMFGLANQAEMMAINKALRAITGDEAQTLTKGEQKEVAAILSRSSSFSGHDAAQVARRLELSRLQREAPETEVIERMTKIIDDATEGMSIEAKRIEMARAIKGWQNLRRGLDRAEIHDHMTTRKELLGESQLYRNERNYLQRRSSKLRKKFNSMRPSLKKVVRENIRQARERSLKSLKEARRQGDVLITPDQQLVQILDDAGWLELKGHWAREIKKLDDIEQAYTAVPVGDLVEPATRALLTNQRKLVVELRGKYRSMIDHPEKEIRKLLREAETIGKADVDTYIDDALRKIDETWGKQLDDVNEHLRLLDDARKEINGEIDSIRDYVTRASDEMDEINDRISKFKRRSDLLKERKKLARSERQKAQESLREGLPTTQKGIEARDMARLKNMRPEARASVLARMMDRITTVDHAERFFKKYGELLDEFDSETITKAREALSGDTSLVFRDAIGQPYKPADVQVAGKSMRLTLPQGIIDDIDRWQGNWLANPEVKGILKAFDFLNNTFKVGVTRYFLSFNVRNMYSNVAASFMDIGLAALNPRLHRIAIDVMRGADGTVADKFGNRLVYRSLLGELDGLGIHIDKLNLAEMTGEANKADVIEWLIHKALRQDGATQKAAKVANQVISMPGGIENEARALHYITLRIRGYAPADAARQVNKFLFDYTNLSPTERNAFRRALPFYSWSRFNIQVQIKNLYERPGRIAAQTKIFAGDRGPDGDVLPEYLRGQMSVKLSDDDDGQVWITGIDLPIKNIDMLWKGGIGKTMRDQLGMVTPLIKQPIEFGLGQELFSGQPTRGISPLPRKLAASMDRNLPQWAKDYLEFKQVDQENGIYTANMTKVYLTMKALFLGRLTSEQVRIDELMEELGAGDAAQGAFAALRLMSGMQIRDMDLSDAAQARLYSRSKRIEDILVQSGRMREFTKRYIPKETATVAPRRAAVDMTRFAPGRQ